MKSQGKKGQKFQKCVAPKLGGFHGHLTPQSDHWGHVTTKFPTPIWGSSIREAVMGVSFLRNSKNFKFENVSGKSVRQSSTNCKLVKCEFQGNVKF